MIRSTLACATLLLASTGASAVTTYRADIAAVNGSGISGFLALILDGTTLTANLNVAGLADGVHFLHIHGLDNAAGVPVDITPPSPPVPPNGDTDGNGALTTGEAKAAIGGVILSLMPHTPGTSAELAGPTSSGGTLLFNGTYDLTQNIFETGYSLKDLLPLDYRVFDLHGGIVPLNVDTRYGTTTAPGTYDVNLPIGAGAILLTSTTAVPEPASWALMVAGFGLVGGAMRRHGRTAVHFG